MPHATEVVTGSRPIVVIDDDPEAAVLLRHIFRKAGLANPLRPILDPAGAIREFESYGRGPAAERPLLVLIDLKLPRTNGFELLAWMRDQPVLKDVPRIILTSSLDERDVVRATTLGATGFLTKYPSPATLGAIARLAAKGTADAEFPAGVPELNTQ